MCGILFLIRPSSSTNFSQRLTTLDRRGPDEKAILSGDGFIAGHTRLCITNPMSGKQPIDSEEWVVVHNGEIYNGATHVKSDSYYILDLLQKHDPEKVPEYLDGIFAYVAYNKKTGAFYAARDPIGVIPMYVAYDNESIWFSNELKALKGLPAEVVSGYHNIENYLSLHQSVQYKCVNLCQKTVSCVVCLQVPFKSECI